MTTPQLIAAALPGDDGGTARGWLLVESGVVRERGDGAVPDRLCGRLPEHRAELVLPGLVDIHVHGARGADFAHPGVDPEPAIAHHRSDGATTLVASLATGTPEDTALRIRELRPLVREGRLAGLHLEGPWLSPERRGAHSAALLRAPRPDEVERLIEAGDGAVRVVTLAPELPGALDAIRALVRHGVVAAIGHSDADASTAARAMDAGATLVTHLFNGMRPFHHRDPGVAGAALGDERAAVELIADGRHVDDAAIDVVLRAAADRLVLVSDAMAATGLGDGAYELAGSRVVFDDGVARLAGGGSLAGSTTTLGAAVSRLLGRGVPAATLAEATSARPARVAGLAASTLHAGERADLVAFGADGSRRTMKDGRWLVS